MTRRFELFESSISWWSNAIRSQGLSVWRWFAKPTIFEVSGQATSTGDVRSIQPTDEPLCPEDQAKHHRRLGEQNETARADCADAARYPGSTAIYGGSVGS
jgi:hypothetical protein